MDLVFQFIPLEIVVVLAIGITLFCFLYSKITPPKFDRKGTKFWAKAEGESFVHSGEVLQADDALLRVSQRRLVSKRFGRKIPNPRANRRPRRSP